MLQSPFFPECETFYVGYGTGTYCALCNVHVKIPTRVLLRFHEILHNGGMGGVLADWRPAPQLLLAVLSL